MLRSTTSEVRPVRIGYGRPFGARSALRAAGLVTAVHAVLLLVSPHAAGAAFGAPGDSTFLARACAVLCLSLTIVFWSAARWPASMMQRPVLWAAAVVATGMAGLGAMALIDDTATALAVSVVVLEGLIAVWAGWLVVTDRV